MKAFAFRLPIISFLALLIFMGALPSKAQSRGRWQRHPIHQIAKTMALPVPGADGTDLADFNGDGKLDIVTGWEELGKTFIYQNSGSEATWKNIIVSDKTPSIEDAHFADLDDDGFLDVITAQEGDARTIQIFWGGKDQSADQFFQTSLKVAKKLDLKWMNVESADINNDGATDLVAGSKGPKAGIYWFKAQTSPRQTENWKATKIASVKWVMWLKMTDLDHDGDVDVIFSDRPDRIAWLENPGEKFVEQSQHWTQHSIGQGSAVRWGQLVDMDEDGLKDLVFADQIDGQQTVVSWFKQPTNKNLLPSAWKKYQIAVSKTSNFNPVEAKSLDFKDIDQDGFKDLVIAEGIKGNKIYVLRFKNSVFDADWDGEVVFNEPGSKYDNLDLMDVDQDGDLDIVTSEERKLGVFWLENPN